MDLNGGSSDIFPMDPHNFGGNFLSQMINFIVNNSFYHSETLFVPGSKAIQDAFNCLSKFSLLFWVASGSNSNINSKVTRDLHGSNPRCSKPPPRLNHAASLRQNFTAFCCDSGSEGKFTVPWIFNKISSFTLGPLFKEAERLQSFPVLSLAAALVPPFCNMSPNVAAVPLENNAIEAHRWVNQRPCDVEHRGHSDLSFLNSSWTRVEPITGIEFPTILDDSISGENNSEVLVGTGSRTMTIIRIKSVKVYAFGFYVHPYDVCAKLGPKYASIPVSELNKCHDFFEDLLRGDINMSVRLVVSCNGIKINTVRDAFEKSLRARLMKTNPDTDYHCLKTFDSIFSQDISLRTGTTIDFRRTADGHLITEIGGNHIGTVQSKDLCRAFFDMYIGDIPVSKQTKEEIGNNVASIIRRC